MNHKTDSPETPIVRWSWPVDVKLYDRTPTLYRQEEELLIALSLRPRRGPRAIYINKAIHSSLERLLTPVRDCLNAIGATRLAHTAVTSIIVKEMMRRLRPFWGWTQSEWIETLCPRSDLFIKRHKRCEGYRHDLISVAYLLGQFKDVYALGVMGKRKLADKVFGCQVVKQAIDPVTTRLKSWGGGRSHVDRHYPRLIAELFLLNSSPLLSDLTPDVFELARQSKMAVRLKSLLATFAKVLAALPSLNIILPATTRAWPKTVARALASGVPDQWAEWCVRWYDTSPASPNSRHHTYYNLLTIGRWLAACHPDVTEPGLWTREIAADCIAAVDRMKIGQYSDPQTSHRRTKGKPLKPSAKSDILGRLRIFFKDLQEWGLIDRRFDPMRVLATPKSIRRLIAPDPRIISDEIWAKLLHAGLNLTAEDLPKNECGGDPPTRLPWYPLDMVRAGAAVWLFAGLRSDEILRLRVGCVRWQTDNIVVESSAERLPQGRVCLLEVPTNKTSASFIKPVDATVGQAIAEWEKVRPTQPTSLDRKTSEMAHYLFSYRGHRLGGSYLNQRIIPLLCRKAGVPEQDMRGQITSHRARSTLATQLYNAKNPMTLFELMEWLGHRSPTATQHYAKISPTKLAKSYADAEYFKRNLRTIEVLIDREAVLSGAAARGEAWQYYDLGHGYCTYDFFDQCPHRMACAKCGFYVPKEATRGLLEEGQENLLRMMREISLTDEERSAVEEGIGALKKLTNRLVDIPAPDRRTPVELVQITSSKDM